MDFGIYSHCGSQKAPRKNPIYSRHIPISPFPLKRLQTTRAYKQTQKVRVSIYYLLAEHTALARPPQEGTPSPKGAELGCLSKHYRAPNALFSEGCVSLIPENVSQPEVGCETLSRISCSRHLTGSLGDCPGPFQPDLSLLVTVSACLYSLPGPVLQGFHY